MKELNGLIAFLRDYHQKVMGCEEKALRELELGNNEGYFASMKEKATLMVGILEKSMPYIEGIPSPEKDNVHLTLRRFSNSANMGLHLNSPFYWSALLWDDDAKKGDPDNLQKFITSLEAMMK